MSLDGDVWRCGRQIYRSDPSVYADTGRDANMAESIHISDKLNADAIPDSDPMAVD